MVFQLLFLNLYDSIGLTWFFSVVVIYPQDSPAVDSNDPLAMVNHRDFEPGSKRDEHCNRGYEETVLKEALKEMKDLDVAVKEVRLL